MVLQKLLTVEDVAQYLGVSKHEVHKKHRKWQKDYGIDIIRLSGSDFGHIRFVPSQIEKMALKRWRTNND